MLAREGTASDHLSLYGSRTAKLMTALEVLPIRHLLRHKIDLFQYSRGTWGLPLHRHPLVQQAEILHLHWFNQGFLSIKGLSKLLSLGKPVVWTLHDMWAFTGGCHYDRHCDRYRTGCGQCPYLGKPHTGDLSQRLRKQKARVYQAPNLTLVTPSQWLADCAEASGLFVHPPHLIRYPVDLQVFSPGSQTDARAALGLPHQGVYLLFGAFSLKDSRKGGQLLLAALDMLPDHARQKLHILTVGRSDIQLGGLRHTHLGSISGRANMARVYRAADYTVVPSLQDNLPNMIIESMACNVPVVATPAGGMAEMVTDGQTGYLAAEVSAEAMAIALQRALEEPKMGQAPRELAEQRYLPSLIAGQYVQLYQSLGYKA